MFSCSGTLDFLQRLTHAMLKSCNRPTIGIGRIGAAYEWVLGKRPGGTHTLFCQVSPKKVHNIGQSHAAPFTRCVHNVVKTIYCLVTTSVGRQTLYKQDLCA